MIIDTTDVDARIWSRYEPLYRDVLADGVPDPLIDLFLTEVATARAEIAFLILGFDAPYGSEIFKASLPVDAGGQLAADLVVTLQRFGDTQAQAEARALPILKLFLERLHTLALAPRGRA